MKKVQTLHTARQRAWCQTVTNWVLMEHGIMRHSTAPPAEVTQESSRVLSDYEVDGNAVLDQRLLMFGSLKIISTCDSRLSPTNSKPKTVPLSCIS